MYDTCILFFIAGDAVCKDKIPDSVTCHKHPVTGQPISCDDIHAASIHFGIPISTICKYPISAHAIGCNGNGNVEDYCRKTCSNCRITVLY